jgi:uncharacterized protein YcbX
MFVAELWRYPVKSMAGERLDRCAITSEGIPGDRIVHVEGSRNQVITARSRPRLLLHHARLGDDGEPLVDGRPWQDGSVIRDLALAAGKEARLVRWTGPERFDVLPLLVATDGALSSLDQDDSRRFRPNIVVGGVRGLEERDWEGRRLSIGDSVIQAVRLRPRCIMTTFDPDTAQQDVEILKRIHRELGGTFALDCRVEQAGEVQIGSAVELLD